MLAQLKKHNYLTKMLLNNYFFNTTTSIWRLWLQYWCKPSFPRAAKYKTSKLLWFVRQLENSCLDARVTSSFRLTYFQRKMMIRWSVPEIWQLPWLCMYCTVGSLVFLTVVLCGLCWTNFSLSLLRHQFPEALEYTSVLICLCME